jgi:hypothetical protein
MERLQSKLDPRGPFKSQKTGITAFNSTKDLLKKELQTYRNAAKSPSVYTGQEPVNEPQVEGQMPPADTVWMINTKGKKIPVHESQVENAKKRGLKEVS